MMQVHQKFVEVDAAVATISSTQMVSGQTASQPAPRVVPQFVPQTAPSATAQPRESPGDAGTSQPRDLSQETDMLRRYSVDPKRWTDHKKLDLDMKPEGFVAWRDSVGIPGSRTTRHTQVVDLGGFTESYDRSN